MAAFIAEAFCYLGIIICLVAFRIYVRARQQYGIGNLAVDDYIMVAALVPYTTETVLAHFVRARFAGLTNGGMTPEHRSALSPDDEEYAWRVGGSKVQVAGWCVYVSVLWLVKASLCAFYARLTDGVTGYRLKILIGYGMIISTYLALILAILFSCRPMNHFWQISPDPGNFCQPAHSRLYIFMVMILNVATDLYLVLIPIPMFWGVKIPVLKRLSLMLVFSGAFFVMAAGILRGVLILKDDVDGPAQGSGWAVRESFVAMTTSNLPMIWGFLKVKLAPFLGSLLSSNAGTKRKEGPDPGSIMLGNINDNKDDGVSDAATSDRRLSISSREEVAFGGSRFVREPVTRFNVIPSSTKKGAVSSSTQEVTANHTGRQ